MRLPPIFPLALAHASCDLNQGALPVLLPFFVLEHHITYTAAATIVFAANMVSTVSQPFLGHLADRKSRPWLIPLGVLTAGIGFSCAGLAPSYGVLLLVVALSGLGVAIFHPEGARQAHRIAGSKKATMMSLFTFGGQVGFAVGPLVASAALFTWGLPATAFFALPATVVAVFLWIRFRPVSARIKDKENTQDSSEQNENNDAWVAFFCVAAAVVCRSTIFYGLNTFLPLFWVNVLHETRAAGALALTVLVMGGIAGNLLGGKVADRFGYRTAASVEFALLACVLPLLAFTRDPRWAMLFLLPIGILLSAPNPSMVVLGQSYLPNHIGLSSGVTMGLAFSFGGMTTPFFGWIADHHGLHAAISAVALLPIACTGLVLTLPRLKRPLPI